MLDEFARTYELDDAQTHALLLASAAGTLALAERSAATLQDLVSSVSNPGGLTGVGVSSIRRTLPPVLAELKDVLDQKRETRWRQYLVTNQRGADEDN